MLLLGTVLPQLGCQAARYVRQDQETGVVAIPENTQFWPFHYREQAEKLMIEHFPDGYFIEREELVEFPAGHVSLSEEPSEDSPSRVKLLSNNETSNAPAREYRIYYRRK